MVHKAARRTPKRYVLNSAVCSTDGVYHFKSITIDEAVYWLGLGPYDCFLGYIDIARTLRDLTGFKFRMRRETVKMEPRDEALIYRLQGWRPRMEEKGHIDPVEAAAMATFGLLTKLPGTWASTTSRPDVCKGV